MRSESRRDFGADLTTDRVLAGTGLRGKLALGTVGTGGTGGVSGR